MKKIFFALLFLLALCLPAQAAILYVNNSASCPGSGTTGSPYCSIQNAINNVNAGDNIRIRTGTGVYSETASVSGKNGTSGSPIIMEPDTGANFVIRNTSTGVFTASLKIKESDYWTVRNLTFDGAGVNPSLVALHVQCETKDCVGWTISGNTFKNWTQLVGASNGPNVLLFAGCAVSLGCPQDHTITGIIESNTFQNNDLESIAVLKTSNTHVRNNTITGQRCGRQGDGAANAVGIKDSFGNYSLQVYGNEVHDFVAKASCPLSNGGYMTTTPYWCDVGETNTNNRIYQNTFYNINQNDSTYNGVNGALGHQSNGIFIEAACSGYTVERNIIYNIGNDAITNSYHSLDLSQTPNIYQNNTIYNVLDGFFMKEGVATVRNNIVKNASNAAICHGCGSGSPSLLSVTYDYNLYDDGGSQAKIADYAGIGLLNFANWKTTSGQDAHSPSPANPLFTSVVTPDFHLQSSSPAIDHGQDVGLAFNGAAPDIGAFETGATYWVNPSASGPHCTNRATDPGSGSSSQTVAQGIACLGAGDNLKIKTGTYAETISTSQLSARSSTSYAAATVIEAATGATVTLKPAAGAPAININNNAAVTVKFIIFRNLILDGSNNSPTASDWPGVQLGGGGNGANIQNLKFENIEVKSWSGNGYSLGGEDATGDTMWITGGSIHDVGTSTSQPDDRHGIYAESSNNKVEHVDIYNVTRGYGIHNYGPNPLPSNNIYRGNKIHATGLNTAQARFALLLTGGSGNQAYNNLIYGNQNGIDIGASGQQVINNTLYQNGIACPSCAYPAIKAAGTGQLIVNNELVANQIDTIDTSLATGSTEHFNRKGVDSAAATFTNAGANDFSLKAGSPAINAGTNTGTDIVTDDYAGITRPQNGTKDVGAYEFLASGAAPSIAIVTPTVNAAYSTTLATIALSGTASDDVAVTAVTWACSACTPTAGSASGTTAWSIASIGLASGVNTITVTASDGTLTTSDVITVTRSTQTCQLFLALGMETGSGTTATDSSGLANHGTFGSGVTWAGLASGRFGNALVFDGTGSITIPDANSLDLIDGMTLEAWVYPSAPITDFRAIVVKNYVYYLYAGSDVGYCSTNNAALAGFNNITDQFACDNPSLSINAWSHLAVTYDSANIKIYTNGVLKQTIANPDNMTASSGTMQIGASTFGENFVGKIDEVKGYSCARTAAQILTDSATPVLGATQGLKLGAPTSLKVSAATPLKLGQ